MAVSMAAGVQHLVDDAARTRHLESMTSGSLRLEGASADTDQQRQALEKVAIDFEAIFLAKMMEGMRKNVPGDGGMGEGMAGNIFTSMLDNEIASLASQGGGIGLAEMLVDALSGAAHQPSRGRSAGGLGVRPEVAVSGSQKIRRRGPERYSTAGIALSRPVPGAVTSRYGVRLDPFTGERRFHHGVDLAAANGDPITAAADGRVVFAGVKGGYGNMVILAHEGGVESLYAHASDLLVSVGDRVASGDRVALAGESGRSTGPHLHFEVRKHGHSMLPVFSLK